MTLGAIRFTKSVQHRNNDVTINLLSEVPAVKKKKCEFCDNLFTTQQGLSVHIKCKYPLLVVQTSDPSQKEIDFNVLRRPFVESVVSTLVTDLVNAVVFQTERNRNKEERTQKKSERRGAVKRNQYTSTFKAEVFAVLFMIPCGQRK